MKLKEYVALMRSARDKKLRSRDDLDRLSAGTLLGSIPKEPKGRGCSLVSELRLSDPRGDAFRQLWTDLRFEQVDDPNPAVLVTSTQSKEGRTSTSINLAITAARAGNRVALVDVDLRQPTVATKLGLENSAGLTTALRGAADVSELFQPWGADELCVLTTGETPSNPLALLDSRATRTLMARLGDEFDLVVLDGPPALSAVESLLVAQHVGQILIVAAVGEVRLNDMEEALVAFSALEIPTGIVLNKVPRPPAETGYAARLVGWSATVQDVELAGRQLRNFTPKPRPCLWAAEYVHPIFPEDRSTTISRHVRS